MGKLALLIGVSEYLEGLSALPAATQDVAALQQVLEVPSLGAFDEVRSLLNPTRDEMARTIEKWIEERQADDLALLFFSGHGVKDDRRNLHFAASNTQKDRNKLMRSTAIAARTLHDWLRYSLPKQQVVILDCCFSGAFGELLSRDDGEIALKDQLAAEGRVVLTSTSAVDYSFEEKEAGLSIYTRYLVEGIEKGIADLNGDGFITVDELHDYASRKVKETSPVMSPDVIILKGKGYKIQIARSPQDKPELKYRKEVEKRARKGKFTMPARRMLRDLRREYKLTDQAADAIEAEVLKPFRDYQRKLDEYREALTECIDALSDLDPDTLIDLKDYQKHLGLKDEDVRAIEENLVDSDLAVLAQSAQKLKLPTESDSSETRVPDFGYKTLSECDASKILYLKNIKDPNRWAYTLKHIEEMGGSAESKVFELFWFSGSRGAQNPSAQDLIILHQRARVTHIVEVLDDDVRVDNDGSRRWVRIVWMPSQEDWSGLPHQREILGFDPPTIVGGATLSFQSSGFSNFRQA